MVSCSLRYLLLSENYVGVDLGWRVLRVIFGQLDGAGDPSVGVVDKDATELHPFHR